jgi:hypothetical protein
MIFVFLEPRVYHGFIDYIPYDSSQTIDSTSRSTSNTSIANIHQHLLPLNEPIPFDQSSTSTNNLSSWRRIEGPFAHVLVTSKECISKDIVASSKSTLSDGYLTLQYIRSNDSTRMNLAKTFSKLSDGKHFDYDFVEWMHIRAFRIVPNGNHGNMMVDGEKVPFGKIILF